VPVGGSAVGFLLGQRLSPALTDAVMSLPGLGFRSQVTPYPDDARDNVDEPMPGTGRVAGAHQGVVLGHSAFTALVGQRKRVGEVVNGAVTGIRRRAHRAP
jgi:hypothetical protein